MDETQRRIEAIRRVAQGEPITDVCAELNRSRAWYYKWLERFQASGVLGLADQRRQHSPSHTTPDWLKELAIETRDRLVKQAQNGTSFQGIGAREVVRELRRLEIDVPHWTTIHRILKGADRITQSIKSIGYCPRPIVDGLNSVHQVDIWPRVLQGGERFNFFHLVDVACWYPHGAVTDDKSTDTALSFLVGGWQTIGLAHIVQFDNEMTFTGGRWAHRLGRIVRLCLAVGVQVWLIPSTPLSATAMQNAFMASVTSSFGHGSDSRPCLRFVQLTLISWTTFAISASYRPSRTTRQPRCEPLGLMFQFGFCHLTSVYISGDSSRLWLAPSTVSAWQTIKGKSIFSTTTLHWEATTPNTMFSPGSIQPINR